ncbi:MAG TPA: hypothetical protein ENI98_02030 [Gammaproteobacteria bacterium]|nr:hypothetical protein [Gammaproteobacteria bacterium]
MAENTDKILLGARGWLHPGWLDSFYPHDLPRDWQLAYYSHEFSMVVIRAQEWAQIDSMAELRKDCAEDFYFLAELPVSAADSLSASIDIIRQLGSQCAGVIIPAQQFGACRAELPEAIPCYYDGYAESETNGLIKVPRGTDLKALRLSLESALRISASCPVRVIIEGDPPDIELLRHAEIMLGLL